MICLVQYSKKTLVVKKQKKKCRSHPIHVMVDFLTQWGDSNNISLSC